MSVSRLAAVAAVLAAAFLAVPVRATVFSPETFSLPNGLQVVVIPDHRAPVVQNMIWYRIGAADEVAGKSGIAHFLEHLMFKGTTAVPKGGFSSTVARIGGQQNAFTSYDYTGYFETVARDQLELVIRLEADRMVNLKLTDAEVNPERQVILEERAMRTDSRPGALLEEQMSAAQFLNHPYHRPVIGWEHEMRGLTTADALAWYRKYYTPSNAILVISGDVTAAEVRPLAEKYFGPIKSRPIPVRVRPQEPPQRVARRVTLEDARVRQPVLNRSYLAPSRHGGETKHAIPLEVLAEILGSGTGRMQRDLVLNGGIATSAHAEYESTSYDSSTFGFRLGLKAGGDMNVLEAGLDKVLADLLRDGITEAELVRAKTGMVSSAVFARDSVTAGARTFGAALTAGLTIADVENWPDAVQAVTVDQVNAAARYVFDPKRSVTGLLLPKPQS